MAQLCDCDEEQHFEVVDNGGMDRVDLSEAPYWMPLPEPPNKSMSGPNGREEP
jgi:hypothetical protein